MLKTTPWNKIKAEYLQGVTPKELAQKYNIDDIDKLYKKIENGKWADELREIQGKIGNKIQNRIEGLTNLALDGLECVLKDVNAEDKDKISAAKAILDISGLKSSKQEVSGKVEVQKIFITPEMEQEAEEYTNKLLNYDK